MSEQLQQSPNPFLKFFPITSEIKEPRFIQNDVLEDLWGKFSTSKRFKLICPVGAGKSAMALAIARYAESLDLRTLISSPLNELVNQYASSFSEVGLFTLKGRRNYPCAAGMKDASKGYCRRDDCSQGLQNRECYKHDECYKCKCRECVYPPLVKKFRSSYIANTNFTMFLLGISNQPDVIILDEADMAEDFIRMQYSLTVDDHLSKDFNEAIKQLEDRQRELQEMLKEDEDEDINSM